mmetsp:Transcript_41920/g.135980  ORF Transcript_41920/g.135980 Transcript_41920/m.135980 type:complete len:270 (+) Transcript_41920:394-1203(+)
MMRGSPGDESTGRCGGCGASLLCGRGSSEAESRATSGYPRAADTRASSARRQQSPSLAARCGESPQRSCEASPRADRAAATRRTRSQRRRACTLDNLHVVHVGLSAACAGPAPPPLGPTSRAAPAEAPCPALPTPLGRRDARAISDASAAAVTQKEQCPRRTGRPQLAQRGRGASAEARLERGIIFDEDRRCVAGSDRSEESYICGPDAEHFVRLLERFGHEGGIERMQHACWHVLPQLRRPDGPLDYQRAKAVPLRQRAPVIPPATRI